MADRGMETTHLQIDVGHAGKQTQARRGTDLGELEEKHAGKASYFGRIDILHCIQAPGQSNDNLIIYW